ncbi:MAG: DUF411 domain-containing protein [Pseudolabrys sp.]
MTVFTRRAALLAAAVSLAAPRMAFAAAPSITVHKDPNCGCCGGWVEHLRASGFTAQVIETAEVNRVKARLGVPGDLAACHTAEIGGYVIEGHVPADAITKLLAARPNVRGLAVPGMPAGSPGMGGDPETYDVIAFEVGGKTRVFGRYRGADAI